MGYYGPDGRDLRRRLGEEEFDVHIQCFLWHYITKNKKKSKRFFKKSEKIADAKRVHTYVETTLECAQGVFFG